MILKKPRIKIISVILAMSALLTAVSAGIYIYSDRMHSPETPSVTETQNHPANDLTDLNSATAEELMAIKGIGETIADRIIAYRNENGPFSDVGDLVNVAGISSERAERLREKLYVNSADRTLPESSSESADISSALPEKATEPQNIRIDINTADKEDFCLLDGIGEVTAEEIIKLRGELGGFSDISQLKEVNGIGEKKFNAIADNIYIGEIPETSVPMRSVGTDVTSDESGAPAAVNINLASAEELMTLEGIGEVTAEAIIEYRNENGAFSSPEDIMNVKGIGEKKYKKICGMICV